MPGGVIAPACLWKKFSKIEQEDQSLGYEYLSDPRQSLGGGCTEGVAGENINVWEGLFIALTSPGASAPLEAACVTEELLLLGLSTCWAKGLGGTWT